MKKFIFFHAILFSLNMYGQNVGIGTSNPLTKLEVSGSETFISGENATIRLVNTASANSWYFRAGAAGTSTQNGALSIGDNTSHRFTITSTGNIGINWYNPPARLSIAGDFAVATSSSLPVTPGTPPISSGAGLMWYADKAALRFGVSSSNEWNKDSIGTYSASGGWGSKAIGNFGSFAFGLNSIARGASAIALGSNLKSNGDNSFTAGYLNIAASDYSVALGTENIASGGYAFAMGFQSDATGLGSVAMGYNSIASGELSVAIGNSNNSSGTYAIAAGNASIASGNFSSLALGHADTASGNSAIALGQSNISSGNNSFSAGFSNEASNQSAFAIGYNNTASSSFATAMGYNSISKANYAFAAGNSLKAKSYSGFTAGAFNDTTNAGSPNGFNNANRIFQIGNGTADNARNNAVTVLQSGYVGIDTITPAAKLHLNEGDVLFSSAGDIPGSPNNPPASGTGRRMMWYADKAAFRAGYVSGAFWDNSYIGNYSLAIGKGTVASGTASVSLGWANTASEYGAFAAGVNNYSLSYQSVAMGSGNIARGSGSVALGYFNKARAFCSFVSGRFNDTTGTDDSENPVAGNRIFMIGNGTADNARSNAMTVLQNGNIGIGEVSPAVPLNFASALGNKIALWGNGANHYGFGIQASLLQMYSSDATTDIAFGYGNSGLFTERMRIKGNGNVGIGTSSPGAKLEVNGETKTSQLKVSDNGTTISNLQKGTFGIGTSASAFKTVTVNFPNAFSAIPVLTATVRSDPGYNVNDTFVATIRSISSTSVTFNIQRVDIAGGWSQNLLLDWIAIQ